MQNIHKLNLLTISIAMAISGGAHASAMGAANEIFIGGATAPANFIREDTMIRLCDATAAPVQVFTEQVATLPSVTPGGTILGNGNHQVVRCTTKASLGGAIAGKDIAIYKFNGGSATGVAPVADVTAVDFLDASVAGCTAVTGGIGGANAWPISASADTYELYECTNVALIKPQVPDAGVSDVEPKVFVGPLALNFGIEPTGTTQKATQNFVDKGNLNVKPGPGLVFGTGVSLPMYNEMGGDQYAAGMLSDCETVLGEVGAPTRAAYDGAAQSVRDRVECMPSMPSAAIRATFTGQVTDWSQLAPYGLSLDPGKVEQKNNVHLCKRTNGSGTHAQFSVNYMATNCSATGNLPMIEQNDGVSAAFAGIAGMYANKGSSDMDDCLDALGNGLGFNGDFGSLPQSTATKKGDSSVVPGSGLFATGIVESAAFGGFHPLGQTYNNGGVPFTAYGMGYNSLEKNTGLTFDYRFIKVDGIAPTLQEAVAGNYSDVYFLSYQNRDVAGSADLQTGAIRTVAATATQTGVADAYFAIWNATAPAALAAVNAGLEIDPDGIAGNGDEWQSGYVSPISGAAFAYDGSTPATPWSRQAVDKSADSCQDQGLVR